MKHICVFLLSFALLAGLAYGQNSETTSKLSNIKKIYVDTLGRSDDSELIREKIKLRLEKSGVFTVVKTRDEADAVLTGTVVISQQVKGGFDDVETGNKGVAVFYLRDAETDSTLWTYEFKPNPFNIVITTDKATRGYNQVANRTVDRLLKDSGNKKK